MYRSEVIVRCNESPRVAAGSRHDGRTYAHDGAPSEQLGTEERLAADHHTPPELERRRTTAFPPRGGRRGVGGSKRKEKKKEFARENVYSLRFHTLELKYLPEERREASMPDLPQEVLEAVLMFLPAPSLLLSCALVCRSWRNIVQSNRFWRHKCRRDHWPECVYADSKLLSTCADCKLLYWRLQQNCLREHTRGLAVSLDRCCHDNSRGGRGSEMVVRVFFIGDGGVGKTSILARLLNQVDRDFRTRKQGHRLAPTSGVAFSSYAVKSQAEGTRSKCLVWDHSGSSSYTNQLIDNYERGHVFALVYDITSPTSFRNTFTWLGHVRNMCSSKVPVVLVGNKLDLRAERGVGREEAEAMALEHGLLYLECSARDRVNVEQLCIYLSVAGRLFMNKHSFE